MSSTFVEPTRESGPRPHGSVSHHDSQPNRETRRKQNEHTCRDASSLLLSSRPPPIRAHSKALLSLFVAVFFWSSLIGPASATNGDHSSLAAIHVEDNLAWMGSALHIDRSPPPVVPLLMPPLHNGEEPINTASAFLAERAVNTDSTAGSSDFAVPEPFDAGLSNNFTGSCASFFTRLKTDDSFKKCHPLSLMLQTSDGFFDASKSFLRITQTLDATCGVNATQCKQIMDGLARELVSSSVCKTDLDNNSPQVVQALNGLVAYPVAYQASCLRDSEGNYCFANAVTNTSSPTDAYPYHLPIGQELPAATRPTCNSCLQNAMAVFAQYSNNVTQPISKTYGPASQQLTMACGVSFVNVTAAPLRGAAPTTSVALTPTLTLILMFLLFFFQ